MLRRVDQGLLRIGWRRPELTPTRIVLLATTSVILVPYLLPGMHERYFCLADVLSVIAAFHLPRRLWYVPILVQISSFGSYLQYLSTQGDMGGGGGGKGFVSTGPGPKGEPLPSDGAAVPAPPGDHGASGGGFEKIQGGPGPTSGYTSTELKAYAVLMGLALLAVLWVTFRDFRRTNSAIADPTADVPARTPS